MEFERLIKDSRTMRVLGFLVAKGLLINNQIKTRRAGTFSIEDALWVAKNVEQRVLEVLPAAVLHFPAAIDGKERMPKKLAEVIECIIANKKDGPSFGAINYSNMKRWANHPLKDRRTKPVKEQKKMKSFKLSPAARERLSQLAKQSNQTETAVLENILLHS